MSQQTKITIGLAVVFVGLLGGMGWQYWHNQTTTQQATVQRQFVADFSVDAVNMITITKGDQISTMTKVDGKWSYSLSSDSTVVPDDAAVKALISTLHDSSIQATVATNADQAATYGLGDTVKMHITLQAEDKTVADVMVGDVGKPANTWYGSRVDSSTVYLVSGNRSNLANDAWKYWNVPTESES